MRVARFVAQVVVGTAPVMLFAWGMMSSPSLAAQSSNTPPRITSAVDESSLMVLKGNVSGLARAEHDRGPAAPSVQLSHVRVVLSRSPEQEAALGAFMAEQLEKSSPNYHKWLTPEELGRQYGPADSDIAAIVAWLESHGLHVDSVAPSRIDIAFSGSVSQVEEALHTSIHQYEASGQQFYANVSEPSIPLALAKVITGFAHLNTYKPRTHNVPGMPGMLDKESKRLVPASEAGIRPDLTEGSAGNYTLYVVPADAATIYDTPNSLNANFSTGTSYTGTGVTIGIGGDALIQAATVVDYRTLLMSNTTAPTITNVGNTATAGPNTDEAYIDVELSGGLAPGAAIHFYTASDLQTAIDQMLTDNTVDIFSLSFGACEKVNSTADNQLISGWWQQASVQGIAVTVSTGDSGSAGCDDPNSETVAADGLQVSGWASTPYNIAVGGTDFYGLISGFTTYVNTTNGTNLGSAKGYIPESTWNDSTFPNGLISANVPYLSSAMTDIVGGGGGASSCSTNTVTGGVVTCNSGTAKPTWQRGTGVPNDSVRDLPDVSLMAGNGFYGSAWLVCTDDTETVSGVSRTTNCTSQGGSVYFNAFGGTSTAAPAFAGILALVQQKVGSRLGADAPKTLYDLFNGAHASAVFHDETQGNNSVVCTSGTLNCSLNTAGNDFLTGYNTTTGYDLATGIGSVDATQLINYWGSATGSGTATVTATPSPATINVNQSLSVAVTVAGSGGLGTPTGTVTLSATGYTSPAQTLVSGAYTFTVPAGSLATGSDNLTVTYSGDANYATATGTATVTVTKLTPTVTATPSASSILSNVQLTVTAAVTGTGATPTGTVSLSGGGYSSGNKTLTSGGYTFTIPANSLSAGSDTLTVSYGGDSNYATANGTTTVTVTQYVALTPTVTVTPASNSIDTGQSLNVTAAVTGSGATPTGTVTISGGGYTSSAQTLLSGSYMFAIPANSLSAGSDTLTVSYAGDTVYTAGTGTASVTVTASAFALAATTPSGVNPGSSASSTISLTSSTDYSGTVTLACALTGSPAGATDLPTCSAATGGGSITVTGGTPGGTGTMTVNTTAASSSMNKPHIGGWAEAGSGVVLALLVFFGIPARRRGWRAMLGVFVLILALGSLGACGGGGGGGGGNGNPGTTAGLYTFTVTGTGSPAVSPAPTTTFTVTVN